MKATEFVLEVGQKSGHFRKEWERLKDLLETSHNLLRSIGVSKWSITAIMLGLNQVIVETNNNPTYHRLDPLGAEVVDQKDVDEANFSQFFKIGVKLLPEAYQGIALEEWRKNELD